MDYSQRLQLTDKGTDEVAHRTFKLGIKLRSVLLLLQHPQTVEFAVQKSVFPKEDILAAIDTLIEDGFISPAADDSAASAPKPDIRAAASAPVAPVSGFSRMALSMPQVSPTPEDESTVPALTASDFTLDNEIILSEAKFLLIDFCVDCFGMQSEKIADDIRVSKSIGALRAVLKELSGLVGAHHRQQLLKLREIVRQINETA